MKKRIGTGNGIEKRKALEDDTVYIEGWANKAIVDRGRDLISKDQWNLGNFGKNSILLFGHEHDNPIGKVLSVEARDEGLFMKARISKSKDPGISRIRDLISEGILNSLSVGIAVSDVEMKGGTNYLKGVELNEISVVSVPMNQDSQFSLSVKSLGEMSYVKSIAAVSSSELKAKVCEKLSAKHGDIGSLKEIVKLLSDDAGVTEEEAEKFMKGEEEPEAIKEFAEGEEEPSAKQKFEEEGAAILQAEEAPAWADAEKWAAAKAKSEADLGELSLAYTLLSYLQDAPEEVVQTDDQSKGMITDDVSAQENPLFKLVSDTLSLVQQIAVKLDLTTDNDASDTTPPPPQEEEGEEQVPEEDVKKLQELIQKTLERFEIKA